MALQQFRLTAVALLLSLSTFAAQAATTAPSTAAPAAPTAVTAPAAKSALPKVSILATGGTIAGTANSANNAYLYKAGALSIQTLIDAVPALKNVADVTGEQIVKISSNNMTDEILIKLAQRCNELARDPSIAGIVITHGTDTLEETAYFLNLTVKTDKPIVLVGSMRPATAISADGPANLLNAVIAAVSPEAKGKGVLVILNDEINGARDVTKTNTNNVATFKAPELGFLGYMREGKPYFYRTSTRTHTAASEFDVSKLEHLPRVDILYSHVSDDGVLAKASVAAGAQGIVHAGTGDGSIADETEKALFDATKKGVVVVRSSRVGSGITKEGDELYTQHGYIQGDTLSPQKARILLQLALTKTHDPKVIQTIFDRY